MHTFPSLSQLGWKAYFQQQLSLDDLSDFSMARVAIVERSVITLLSDTGRLSIPVTSSMPAITVGDWVLLDENQHFVRLLDRLSLLDRKAPGTERAKQLIAANIDTAFIVSSLNQDFNVNRLERYLALVHEVGIAPVVVLTKKDLCEDAESLVESVQALDPMLPVIAINALDQACLHELNDWLGMGNTVAFIGSSGVGKSTLINTVLGVTVQQTGGIREDDAKGRHTTSSRSLHLLDSGAVLLDTPGMRELQLANCEHGLEETFMDIVSLSEQCKFKDCQHDSEPGCAVQNAIESGLLEKRRLVSYQKLMREQAFNSASLAERKATDSEFGKMVKAVKQLKPHRR